MRLRTFAAFSMLAVAACTNDLPVVPGGGAVLRIQPDFPSNFALFAQALSIQSAAITVTSVPDSIVLLHTITGFNPASDTLRLAVMVPFKGDSASVSVALSFLDQNGAALFVDTIPLISLVRGEASAPSTGQFPVRYVGPGSNASTVVLAPKLDTIVASGTLQFTITALDDLGDTLPKVYVHWSSANSQARIDATGKLSGPGVAGQTVVYATLPSSISGTGFVQDSALITFTGPVPPNAGTINGSVVDGSSLLPDSGAAIQASLVGGGTTFNATTSAAGTFSLGPLPAGTYNLTINAAGHTGTKYLNAVMPAGSGVIIVLPPVPLVTITGKSGALAGTVTDAQTALPLAGAKVLLHSYANAQGTAAVDSILTDTTGTFTFSNHAEGTYTLEASASGYVAGTRTALVFGSTTTGSQNVVMSKGGPQFRAVLTWSATPPDLDLHALVTDTLGVRTEVNFSNPGDTSFVALDHDVTTGYGPETMTIYHMFPGVDTFFVENFSAGGANPDTTLARSGATVRVYNNDALLTTLYVPNVPGDRWYLFTWNGTTLAPLGGMTYQAPRLPSGVAAKRAKPKTVRRR
ncbi:MAG: carboxypeptidase regulatory-like domain-containing protein [Gemmatimonadales bacterium]